MRILMLNHNLLGRGTWHRAWQLGRELARRGHCVTIWTAAPNHYYRPTVHEEDGVRVLQTPSWAPLVGSDDGWGPLDVPYRCVRILFEEFDLCYAFAHPPNVLLPAWLAKCIKRKPVLYDWCDWYEGGIFPKRQLMRQRGEAPAGEPPLQAAAERWEVGLERRSLKMAGRATVISHYLYDLAMRAGRKPEELMVLPNGANLDVIEPTEPAKCRRRLGLPEQGPLLAYVANYHPDQALLLEALKLAAARVPGLRLVKTGPPFSPALVARLGVEELIVDLGWIAAERLPMVLGAGDAAVLPLEDNDSNRARVPFKFTDYLAAGRPVLSNLVGDLREYYSASRPPIGLATAPEPEAFAQAMADIFAPECDRAQMGVNARALAEQAFSWSSLADQWEAFVGSWLGWPPSSPPASRED